MAKDWKLSEALEGKYEVVNTDLPVLHSRIGEVDLRTMTEEQAEAILLKGSDFLKKIPAKKKTAE